MRLVFAQVGGTASVMVGPQSGRTKLLISQAFAPAPIPEAETGSLTAIAGGQSAALELQARINIITVIPAGGGVRLKQILGNRQEVLPRGGATLIVWPSSGSQVEGYGVDQSVTVSDGGDGIFTFNPDENTWYVS